MYRIGKTDTSSASPDFFHIDRVPIVKERPAVSQKMLKPELKNRNSLDYAFSHYTLPLGQGPKAFSKNLSSNEVALQSVRSTIELVKGQRPSIYYGSELFSSYDKALKGGGFNKNKNELNDLKSNRILRNDLNEIQKLKFRIQKAKKKKRLLMDYLKSLKN